MSRAVGVDLSWWDVSFDPRKATKQIDFAILRTGYGLMKDSAFEKLYAGVALVPIRGAYHYLSTGVPWQAQADKFLSSVADREFHFYVCDFEEAYNEMTVKFSMEANQWMDYVSRASGKRVMLYTSPNLYDLYAWHYCSSWPLWLAQYWSLLPKPGRNPALPKKRKAGDWHIWQWASEINYKGHAKEYGCLETNSVDIDVFNGTVEEMRIWLQLDDIPLPTPPAIGENVARLKELDLVQAYITTRKAQLEE